MSVDKERLDITLVNKGLVSSREKAKSAIMAGLIYVDGNRVDKPGTFVNPLDNITMKGDDNPYVSRGGLKLAKAIELFNVPVSQAVYMDVGASTGGFTDCLLKNGAKKVYAIDVGFGQLDWKIRQDDRVVVMERTNIRYVRQEDLRDRIDGATIDVSFISLNIVLPVVAKILKNEGHIISLIKPQFEAGRGKVGKKGVVRDFNVHIEVLKNISLLCNNIGLSINDLCYSPITGPEGNIEFFVHAFKGNLSFEERDIDSLIDNVVKQAHSVHNV